MGRYARVDYNLTICPLLRRLQHLYTMANPIPELTLTLCQCRLFPPLMDKELGVRNSCRRRYICLVEFLKTAKRIRSIRFPIISVAIWVFLHIVQVLVGMPIWKELTTEATVVHRHSLFGLLFTALLIGRPRNPPPPHLGSYSRALLGSQDRRHLFVTPCIIPIMIVHKIDTTRSGKYKDDLFYPIKNGGKLSKRGKNSCKTHTLFLLSSHRQRFTVKLIPEFWPVFSW